ncbi:DUF2786 domain-containing protein [Propionibacteriaceae bacterium Y2011]
MTTSSPFGVPDNPFGNPDAHRSPRAEARRVLAAVPHRAIPVWLAIQELNRLPHQAVMREAAELLARQLRLAYEGGWQPAELVRHLRTRVNTTAGDLTRRVVTADALMRAVPHVDPRWQAQLDELAVNGVPGSHDWLDVWTRSREARRASDLQTVVEVVQQFQLLPRLEVLITPPGLTPRGPVLGAAAGQSADPVLQKVRALLAKAESTEYEAEAMTFTAKAQELMTRHAIDQAVVEGSRPTTGPAVVRLPVDAPYADAKALLLQTIAAETRCRALYLGGDVQLSNVVGFPTDLAAVELLYTSLLVQAQHALAEVTAGVPAGTRRRSTGFKSAFLQGFANRIGDRLAEVNRLAYSDDRAETFLPVLRSRDEQVDAFMGDTFGRTTQSRVRGGYDHDGYHRGGMAGDAARLTDGVIAS